MHQFTFNGEVIRAETGETVLSALTRNGKAVKSGCRAGACQSCLLIGKGTPNSASQVGLDPTLIEAGAFLSCQAPAALFESVTSVEGAQRPSYEAELLSTAWLSDDVLLVNLDAPEFCGDPGRFIHLIHSSGISRPYSLAAPAWAVRGKISLHVRIIPGGEMSELLTAANPGEKFTVEGPLGRCRYNDDRPDVPILMIGTGTGLAPLYAIATDALMNGHRGPIHLFHGAATSKRLYFREQLEELVDKYKNFHLSTCAESEVRGDDLEGSPLTLALEAHPDLEGFLVYLCGHPEVVRIGQRKCFIAGADLSDIAADPFVAAS